MVEPRLGDPTALTTSLRTPTFARNSTMPTTGADVSSPRARRAQDEPQKNRDRAEYQYGQGEAASGEAPDAEDQRVNTPLKSPDLIAVNALGQFQEHPRVAALRDFIMGWHVSYLSAESARGQPEAGPHERLTRTGDNLANVIQYLSERHPDRLERIFEILRGRVPANRTRGR